VFAFGRWICGLGNIISCYSEFVGVCVKIHDTSLRVCMLPTGSCADLLLCCNSNKFLTTAPSFFLSSSSQGSSACHVLITVVAANQSQRRRSKSKASPPVVSGSNGLDQVEVSSTNQQFASRGTDLDGKEADLSQLQPDGAQLIASRSDVLRACVSTSAGIALAGACIRQVCPSPSLLRF
jgi:hypothetical protein